MSYAIIRSPMFVRAAKRLLKRQPDLRDAVVRTVASLSQDPFAPPLRTHKLKGRLADRWSCSVAHEIRILFQFVEGTAEPTLELLTIGTHDEVY